MKALIKGLHHFSTTEFAHYSELFKHLTSEGQKPETLFITCSDSRVVPCLMTNSNPGDLFVIRNAGNIVPPYGAGDEGMEGTIEYAVRALQVSDIVICGHSHCGAMHGALHPHNLDKLPAVKRWLRHTDRTRQIVHDHYNDLPENLQLEVAIQENVLAQVEALRTHPSVASRIAEGTLHIHAWVYKIEGGYVLGYDPVAEQFQRITPENSAQTVVEARSRLHASNPLVA